MDKRRPRRVLYAFLATLMMLVGVVGILGLMAGTSLALGWAEGHPLVGEVAVWAGGVAVLIVGAAVVTEVWIHLYRALERHYDD